MCFNFHKKGVILFLSILRKIHNVWLKKNSDLDITSPKYTSLPCPFYAKNYLNFCCACCTKWSEIYINRALPASTLMLSTIPTHFPATANNFVQFQLGANPNTKQS